MKINVLPLEIANMIAAGEVVERPASVVKELVENSVDAGSTNIVIEIKKGGMTFIRVSDNGCGIESEYAKTAFLRHATSKIATEEDLNSIYTLGFRGEALASISAVARVSLFTKPKEQQFGYSVTIEGGTVTHESQAGCADGTTVTVRDLFYNTPARMKFLKNDATETSYVNDVVNKMILSHPEIAFHLINNGKTVIRSYGDGKLINAIYSVFGKDYAKNMTEVNHSEENISVSGFIGNASIARKDRRHQIFYINGRNVGGKVMSMAVSEAYKNTFMTGKFPVVILNIKLNTNFVDVNVHPTKMEVRFSDDKKVYQAVYWAVKNALSENKYIPEIKVYSQTPSQKIMAAPAYDIPKDEQREINMLRDDYIRDNIAPKEKTYTQKNDVGLSFKQAPSINRAIEIDKNTPENEPAAKFDKSYENEQFQDDNHSYGDDRFVIKKLEDLSPVSQKDAPINDFSENISSYENPVIVKADIDFKIIGQAFGTYIILQIENDMVFIDQHAAHERLYFEEFLADYKNKSFSPQILLIPITMEFTPTDYNVVMSNIKMFEDFGFEIDSFGESSIIVRQIPYSEDEHIVKDTINEITRLLAESHVDIKKQIYEEALHTMACKRAVKGNRELSKAEMESLCERVLALKDINTCPHGRPIMTKMSKYQLEKQFKRIV